MSGILNAFVGCTYSGVPGAPTIGTATATGSTTATVAFTAPTNTGGLPITGYQAISSPGSITATGTSSPITVSCLSPSTTYTFQVRAQNSLGYGAYSGSSNSITTPALIGSQSYTSSGTYSWVAPAGVTSVSIVAVGGGGSGSTNYPNSKGGGGGGLAWKNNYSVTPGNSYTVKVGGGGGIGGPYNQPGGHSYFINVCTIRGGGAGCGYLCGYTGGTYLGCGGGNGGNGVQFSGGAGAGGYGGSGGNGTTRSGCGGNPGGSGSCGGGGAGKNITFIPFGCCQAYIGASGGGGVGIFGKGTSGSSCAGGSGGSAGTAGRRSCGYCTYGSHGGNGGLYGGGGGASPAFSYNWPTTHAGTGADGAVRIVWPGNTRRFPSTCVGTP